MDAKALNEWTTVKHAQNTSGKREEEKMTRPPPGQRCLASKVTWHLYFDQNRSLAVHLAEVLFRPRFGHGRKLHGNYMSIYRSCVCPPRIRRFSPFSVKSKGTLKRKIYLSRQSYLTSEISVIAVVVCMWLDQHVSPFL